MPTSTTELEEADRLLDHNVFEGIEIDTVPSMPEDLREFDVAASRKVVASEGMTVFLFWLRKRLGISDAHAWTTGEPVNCAKEFSSREIAPGERVEDDLDDPFFLNWPDPDDYPSGREDLEFGRRQMNVEIKIAREKKICATCPVRKVCLAIACMSSDQMVNTGIPEPDGAGATIRILPYEEYVQGGSGPRARAAIVNSMTKLRRSYERGIAEEQAGVRRKERTGMPADIRDQYEEEARALMPKEW